MNVKITRLPCQIINNVPCDECLPAEPIFDKLLNNVSSALERGNAYLDRYGYDFKKVNCGGVLNDNYETGKVLHVNTGDVPIQGQITSWSLNISMSDKSVKASSSYVIDTL